MITKGLTILQKDKYMIISYDCDKYSYLKLKNLLPKDFNYKLTQYKFVHKDFNQMKHYDYEPIYREGFMHKMYFIFVDKYHASFVKYLIEKRIKNILKLEKNFNKELINK